MARRPSAAAQAAQPPARIFPAIPPADVLGRLAALKDTPTADLKQQWRDLFGTEPPPYNRRFLENRLAYRIQELAYGGLKPTPFRVLGRFHFSSRDCIDERERNYLDLCP